MTGWQQEAGDGSSPNLSRTPQPSVRPTSWPPLLAEIVMLKPPDDDTRLELSRFVRPDSVPGSPAAMANELGLRNVAFQVNDLQAAVDWAARDRPLAELIG